MATGSKSRKYGRDTKKCNRYKTEGRRERNKERRRLKEAKRQAKFKARKEALKKDIEESKKVDLDNVKEEQPPVSPVASNHLEG